MKNKKIVIKTIVEDIDQKKVDKEALKESLRKKKALINNDKIVTK